MAQLVYIDETGSVGRGANNHHYLKLVAVVVEETVVQALAGRMRDLAIKHLGRIPEGFEFHGREVWHGIGHWKGKTPTELLAAFEDVIGLLEELRINVVHATIDSSR